MAVKPKKPAPQRTVFVGLEPELWKSMSAADIVEEIVNRIVDLSIPNADR